MKEIDDLLEYPRNRSTLIEEAVRDYLERNRRPSGNLRDLELINNSVDELNQEALEVLSYQVAL